MVDEIQSSSGIKACYKLILRNIKNSNNIGVHFNTFESGGYQAFQCVALTSVLKCSWYRLMCLILQLAFLWFANLHMQYFVQKTEDTGGFV